MPWQEVMSKWGQGTLRSGSGGKVKSQRQAVAIMLSEKRSKKPEYHSLAKAIGKKSR